MRALRNITIIALLALIIDVVPGGGNAASAIVTAFSLIFMVLVGFACLQLYRQYRLSYLGLPERQRAVFVGSLGAIVLMIAGADELTGTGAGLLVWLGVIGLAVFLIVRVWQEARSY